jgi:amino acid adenylation domain-containing protein
MATVNTPLPMDSEQPARAGQKLRDGEPLSLVAELIAAQAQRSPHALALASRNQVLTYADMEAKADQLFHYLQSIGVGPEVLVGVCLDRGPSMVVAALAILKAGGAYLPLDPEFPVDRLRFVLDDAQARVLITRYEIDKRIGKGRWRVVEIDADETRIASHPKIPPAVSISAENLAYVIYTSGSTGRPKGVQITHANLLNLISWHNRAFSISATDRASQLASLAFDAAVWEIWPYLVAGSSVHFPDDATRVSVEPLRDWLIHEQITVSFVATPLAESLTSLHWPQHSALRILLTGADTLHHYPPPGLPFALVNNYGPTECTVVATSGTVVPDQHPSGLPTIGRAIDNFEIYILDEQLQQVPTGTVGHLHIGGAGVARGYLNRPDLDAERFIANPFSSIPGARLYKTGDLARRLPDGDIAFVGRMDEQIKIRGYRIEPDEIAAVLDRYSGINASVVVAREDSGDKRLVAYVVVATGVALTHSTLQDFLKNYLPDYMVPAAFVQLSSLPMTHSGKVDRAALPAPGPENTIADQIYVAPRTATEERLVAILSELLAVAQVSVNDNFFFLGGHSLLGTQLIARARDAFGVELPLRTVFDFPTAAEISIVIDEMLRRESMTAD